MIDATVFEAQRIVREAAEPRLIGDTIDAAIVRAARRLEIEYSRARTFWYATARQVLASEADHLRARRLEILRERKQRLEHELREIRARLDAGNTDRMAR